MRPPDGSIDLDDLVALERADPAGMLGIVLGLPEQCRVGYRDGREAPELPSGEALDAVVVCGMGGSGVSGDVLAALYRDRLGIPIAVVKNPVLPEFCGKDTLVVCSSYSGTTAETLACFEEATSRGCRVVAVTAGGTLGRRARQEDGPVVPVPEGMTAPRGAIGYLSFGLLGALESMGVIPAIEEEVEECVGVLTRTAATVAADRPESENPAKSLARAVKDRLVLVWGADGIGAVAAQRWKTQLNENAKVPAFSSVLPELDHNEVVGWSAGTGERFTLVTLRHEGEHPDVAARFRATLDVVAGSGLEHREVRATGGSVMADLMELVMMGDAASVYLAYLRGVDPTPIEAIARIKRALEGEQQ